MVTIDDNDVLNSSQPGKKQVGKFSLDDKKLFRESPVIDSPSKRQKWQKGDIIVMYWPSAENGQVKYRVVKTKVHGLCK